MGFEVMEKLTAAGLGKKQYGCSGGDECVFGEFCAGVVVNWLVDGYTGVHKQPPCGTVGAVGLGQNFSSGLLGVRRSIWGLWGI